MRGKLRPFGGASVSDLGSVIPFGWNPTAARVWASSTGPDLRRIRRLGHGARFAVLWGVVRTLLGRLSLLCCLLCCFSLSAQTMGSTESPEAVQPALERFLSRTDEPLTQYRARRVLEGQNPRFNVRGTLEAITELSPNGGFTFTIVSQTGSDYIQEKVLRPLLETEAKVLASGDPSKSALTAENYDIGGGELAEPGIVKLFARPRRKEVSLIDGAVFITSASSDLVRVEGRLAKNPSFWTSRVHLVRRYDRIGGVRVPVRLDSTAQIKFAGESTLSMVYKYEMVNGVAVTE